MKFIKLTEYESNETIYVDITKICKINVRNKITYLHDSIVESQHGHMQVKETPDQILAKL